MDVLRKPGISPVPPSVLPLEVGPIRGAVSSEVEGNVGGMRAFAGFLNDCGEMSSTGVSGSEVSRSFSVGSMTSCSLTPASPIDTSASEALARRVSPSLVAFFGSSGIGKVGRMGIDRLTRGLRSYTRSYS